MTESTPNNADAVAWVSSALGAVGMKPERVTRVVGLTDLQSVTDASDKGAAAQAAVEKLWESYPELRPLPGQSGGELAPAGPKEMSLADFRKLGQREREALYVSDKALYDRLAQRDKLNATR